MLTFTMVRYKNLLSTGNAWSEINLVSNRSTLIVGENGAGKSLMTDAIAFALYGKAFRKINKPQLINSINQRDLLVEVFFTINGSDFIVKRGMKPNIFEIWKNGVLINQDAASRDYQAYLEENILKMNFKSFGQVVILGSSTFVPFMQLPAQHRREVIEDLLDIQIFSTMNTLIKERAQANKSTLSHVKHEVDLIKAKLTSAKEHSESIRQLRADEVDKIEGRIAGHKAYILTEEQTVIDLDRSMEDLKSTIADKAVVQNRDTQYRTLKLDLVQKQKLLDKEVKFYHAYDNCPTCKQGIAHAFKANTINQKSGKISEIQDAISVIDGKLTQTAQRLDDIARTEATLHSTSLIRSDHITNIRIARSTIASLEAELVEARREVEELDTTKLDSFKEELRAAMSKAKTLAEERETISIVAAMLKDGGIKTRIIKQYVPIMNKLINKYLAAMEFFVDFQLDESFNEKILSRHRDEFSYASFSEGEKAKIDIALLLTWRAIASMRNSVSTNLLIMDEVFDGSMDSAGVEFLQKILLEIIDQYALNLFVISHKENRVEGFDAMINVKKVKNFSQLEYTEV